jgi:ABC-type sugar transport system ATPase subunit
MMVGRRIEALFPKLEAKRGPVVLELENIVRAPMTKGVSLKLHAGRDPRHRRAGRLGRSELAEIIFGMTPADSGTIRIDGKPVAINSPSDAKHLGIAYVPEDRGGRGWCAHADRPECLDGQLAAAVARRISSTAPRNGPRRRQRQAVPDRASGIGQIVGKLSGGNQQKVGLSKWLATEPRILIMDEPTRGIDVGAKAEIHRLMSELAQKGMAIIMISSELPEVMGMSDRILVMRAGRLVAEVERADATQPKIAAAMMSDAPSMWRRRRSDAGSEQADERASPLPWGESARGAGG